MSDVKGVTDNDELWFYGQQCHCFGSLAAFINLISSYNRQLFSVKKLW